MKITKAVIPCGGMGSRFLPVTKSVPKEILPIIDTPAVAYIVDEAVKSGITDILIVLGKGKESIKSFFSPNPALEDELMRAGKEKLAREVADLHKKANFSFVYQERPLGSGDAVNRAKDFAGAEPFCLAWGDDVIDSQKPVMAQLIEGYNEVRAPIVGVQYFGGDDITKYGVAKIHGQPPASGKRLFRCAGFDEKPPLERIPSRYAALGRYVVTNEFFDELSGLEMQGGEYRFTDALNTICGKSEVYAYDFAGKRYDTGDKLGYVKATVEYALKREFGEEFREYLQALLKA